MDTKIPTIDLTKGVNRNWRDELRKGNPAFNGPTVEITLTPTEVASQFVVSLGTPEDTVRAAADLKLTDKQLRLALSGTVSGKILKARLNAQIARNKKKV